MNNLELAILGRCLVVSDAELTGSSAVNCAAGEVECLLCPERHWSASSLGVGPASHLARVVATGALEWAVVWLSKGFGGVHDHVSVGAGEEPERDCEEGGLGRLHLESREVLFVVERVWSQVVENCRA